MNSGEGNDKSSEAPAPELLKPQEDKTPAEIIHHDNKKTKPGIRLKFRGAAYRPSHKATFIGLGIVFIILALNAGIITFVISRQNQSESESSSEEVTINTDVLNQLGVSRNSISNAGTKLTIGPDTSFDGTVTIAGDTSLAGDLTLNGTLSASNVKLTGLEAGETELVSLNVSGNSTMTNLNLRENLIVEGSSTLQGSVTINQLLSVGSINVSGNLSVGGILSTRFFQATSLTSDTTLIIGGHIITRGSAPSVSKGGALADTDTVSISGNDASGTVAVNVGVGSRSGILANITFLNSYSSTPHVVVTAVGSGVSDLYVNRTATGFSIGASSIVAGGHAFDYIVVQ